MRQSTNQPANQQTNKPTQVFSRALLYEYVPLAGQIVAATVGFAAIRYFGEEHMKDCIRVARQAQLEIPLLERSH